VDTFILYELAVPERCRSLKRLPVLPRSNSPLLAPPVVVDAGKNALLFPDVHKKASFDPIVISLATTLILPTLAPSFSKPTILPSELSLENLAASAPETVPRTSPLDLRATPAVPVAIVVFPTNRFPPKVAPELNVAAPALLTYQG
jgi:hypothetical protein